MDGDAVSWALVIKNALRREGVSLRAGTGRDAHGNAYFQFDTDTGIFLVTVQQVI